MLSIEVNEVRVILVGKCTVLFKLQIFKKFSGCVVLFGDAGFESVLARHRVNRKKVRFPA